MTPYDMGDIITISALFRVETTPGNAATLTPADPTVVTLRTLSPDGTVTAYVGVGATIIKDSTGAYHADLAPAVSGIWRHRWEGTGDAAGQQEGLFFVRPSRVVAG